MIKKLIFQFPKWAITIGILVISTTMFLFWFYGRETKEPNPFRDPSPRSTPELVIPRKPLLTLDPDTMFVSGPSLYKVVDGEVTMVEFAWLDSTPKITDQIFHLAKEGRIAVFHTPSSITVFDLGGNEIGPLTLSSGRGFDGYVTEEMDRLVYVDQGDLWYGEIKWDTATVINETRVTNLGFFLGRPLLSRMVTGDRNAFIYQDPRHGNVRVTLSTGATDTISFPARYYRAPNGELLIASEPTNPPRLVIYDHQTNEFSNQPLPRGIPTGGVAWLSDTKAAIVLIDELLIYDHENKSLRSIYKTGQNKFSLKLFCPPFRGHDYLVVEDSLKGILFLDEDGFEAKIAGNRISGMELLPDGELFYGRDSPESDSRGTFFHIHSVPYSLPLSSQPYRSTGHSFVCLASEKSGLIRLDKWFYLDFTTKKLTETSLSSQPIAIQSR